MLKGIDVSNWQGGMDVAAVLPNIDFLIAKCTEGLGYVDPTCEKFTLAAWRAGKAVGVYHFARENSPEDEANHFYETGKFGNYWGYYIPVLDWEGDQSVAWVNRFVRQFHARSGIWPWVYANPWRFNQGGVEPNCARWVASYPGSLVNPGLNTDPGEVPATDGLVACWQFASDGRVAGYSGNLDLDHFYGDRDAWNAYAHYQKPVSTPKPNPDKPQPVTLENDQYIVTIERK